MSLRDFRTAFIVLAFVGLIGAVFGSYYSFSGDPGARKQYNEKVVPVMKEINGKIKALQVASFDDADKHIEDLTEIKREINNIKIEGDYPRIEDFLRSLEEYISFLIGGIKAYVKGDYSRKEFARKLKVKSQKVQKYRKKLYDKYGWK